jgi:tetratricopeptide (TPR) repeat protein
VEWTESEYSQRTAMRLARSGAWIRVVAEDDACPVCKAMAQRAYKPADVPRLPVAGCENASCRCRFEAVDPQSELSVPELVDLAVHDIKVGREEQARETLRRAVALDEAYERGWLWLSAVVDDREKIVCLEKALSINPQNAHARAGIEVLRQKLGTIVPPSEPLPEPEDAAPVSLTPVVSEQSATMDRADPVSEDMLATIHALRDEREVIVEQWTEFMGLVDQVDPQVLQTQAEAFVERLQDANEQTLDLLASEQVPPESRLEELYLQWRESEEMGEALAEVIEAHRARDRKAPQWQPMRDVLGSLGREMIAHRTRLREQIAAAGGSIAE